jgi:hypothetical protein
MTGILLGHDTHGDAVESARQLRSMATPACKLLRECVEHQGVKRKSLSAAARALEDAGFIFIRDIGSIWEERFSLTPSLVGEEALDLYERLNAPESMRGET